MNRPSHLLDIAPARTAKPQVEQGRETRSQWQRALEVRCYKFGQIAAFQHDVVFFIGLS